MATIRDQLAWEEQMVQHGVDRFRAQQDTAVENGREHETSAGARLLRSYVLQISDHIKAYLSGNHPEGRRRGKYAKLLDAIDTDKAAMISLKAVISTLFNPVTLQSLCVNIGKLVEDDLRFMEFAAEHKTYYDEIVRQLEVRRSSNYRYQHRNLVSAAKDKGMDWTHWSKEVHYGVGSTILGLLMESCDLVEKQTIHLGKNRREVNVVPTQACVDWVLNHHEAMELANPDRMPCLIPPEDWTTVKTGGYFLPTMRQRTSFVKARASKAGRVQMDLFESAEMPRVFNAVNAMQRTGWSVNARVLETMREVWHKNLGVGMPRSQPYDIPPCPLEAGVKVKELEEGDPRAVIFAEWKAEAREVHSLERERVSKNLALSRTLRTAGALTVHEEFYYVYQCDFRGRVYSATAGLSPQGTDHGKGLLQFAEAKPLGERGLFWLKVHGANKYGADKQDNEDRVAWIDDRREQWIAAAADPIEHSEVWAGADKPYQFLAFCFEYAGAMEHGPEFMSRLPVALDGSCNGLQHFSAMLRDSVGGAAVNLTPSDKPSDIYQAVGDVGTRKLKGLRSLNDDNHGGAVNWLALFEDMNFSGIPRDLAKKPVMTLPYGSTRQACTETIFKWVMEKNPDFFEKSTGFRHAMYLSPILWDSISEVVIAARAAMDWIQECAGILGKAGHPLQYASPLGFPVYQVAYNFTTKCIETQLSGRLQVRIATDTDKINVRKQRQGSSPNFVHQCDATHMHMCVDAGAEEGLTSFAMIHDDFGVHACDTQRWHGIIREQFVKLYEDNDPLAEFKRVHEERHDIELPALPPRGDLDIREVLNSPFFFG